MRRSVIARINDRLKGMIRRRWSVFSAAQHWLRWGRVCAGGLALWCGLLGLTAEASSPGTCLQFNGTNGYVTIAHTAALNAYPLTITAWIKTLRNAPLYDGIASKYPPAGLDGFSLFVYQGHVRAWYFHNQTSYIWNPSGDNQGVDGGFVADGNWHHVALVVGSTGGSIYVDGNLGGSLAWTGSAGPPTTNTVSMLVGRAFQHPSYTNTFSGEIDEVTLWNRALAPSELNYLKHRSLGGKEDGLLAYYRLDEGTGTTAGDSTANAFNGTVVPNPAWVPSQAAIVLDPIATNCLKLDGVNGYVQVAHTNDLNAYPLTATAWFRTTSTAAQFQGIVDKYADASGDGWAIGVQGGQLRGFYYRGGGVANKAIDTLPAGSVADGAWHHVALVVDSSGGKLFLDGALVGSSSWTGVAGASSSSQALLIGTYYTYPQHFVGAIDEVTIWSRALASSEVQSLKNLPLAGTETGLIAYWRLDEGTGTIAADSTQLGHNGTLASGTLWTGSTAFLGDASVHLVAGSGIPNLGRQSAIAIATNASLNSFSVTARGFLRRFYDFGAVPASLPVVTHLDGGLQVAGSGTPLSVNPDTFTNSFTMTSYNASSPQPLFFGGVASLTSGLNIQPGGGVQLDSVNNFHQGVVTLSHSENGGSFSTDGTDTTDPARLLHFDGNLLFGSIQTRFTSINNSPAPGALSGGGIATQLAVNNNSGTLTANPSYHYGNGTALNVVLLSNGDATAATGTTVSLTGSDGGCISNICYTRSGLTLSNSVISGLITLQLPLGLSVCTNFDSTHRLTTPFVTFPISFLDPASLNPLPGSLVQPGPLYVVEETKPFWIKAPSLNWQVTAGQILIANPTGVLFVRQEEDDALAASAGLVTDANTTKRVSNDGYYRNASTVLSGQVTFVADANGVSRMTTQIALNPPELRPHFPYAGNRPGNQIPTSGGQLAIADDLIDPANSALPVTGAVPLIYARDCFDTNCALASISPAVLAFTANGNQLNFTPDGGLLAFGSVPPANLTWGYAGNGNYAQQTSPVQAGAYHMPGNFLRYDQTAQADTQRPGVLLFTGFGNDSDPTYFERPGLASYSDGFANYAGLNFRAPAQGRSYIAQQDTGLYPLTARSKYYARFAGVNGIHESASFPGSLNLYGYPFTFTSYRLSFLDSQNWESRTDGALTLPVPAGFMQEFSRMKFVCKGDLDSAQVPPSSGVKHMVYWDTGITPQSIQFQPLANDVCGTSGRTLVLGVETKLPFLGQAFHAALGFKSNGNLVTAADLVLGVDSRFKVPGHLTLQGPGTSTFSLETAGDGYFNNWETPGRPDAGFYNLAGKIRVPFFSDVKVHLHVTPTGPTTAQINIMGGWPDADGNGENRGWNVGNNNYFNTAKFDKHADGWPQGIPLSAYRVSPNNTYHPRVQRNWIDVAKFDYPLQWNVALHEFAGFVDSKVELPVIDVNSRLKELSPGKVDFDFAQDITLQLPRIKVLDFANDALNELNGPINSVSNAIRQELGQLFNTTGLTSGFRSLQNTLREDASGFFRPIVQPALTPAVNQIYTLLAAVQASNPAGFRTNIIGIVTGAAVNLQTNIQQITGAAGQANTVFGQLNQTLSDADDTLGLFLNVLKKDNTGQRHVVRAIIQKLAHDQGVSPVPDLADGLVNGLLGDLEPTLAKVESELTDLRAQFAQLHSAVATATGDFSSALSTTVYDGAALSAFVQSAGATVSNLLATVVASNPDYFTADPAAARQAILDRLTLAFLGSPLPGNYQQTFRQFLYDNNFVLDQLMDVLFDQINRSIRDGLANQIAGASDGAFSAMKGIGQMSQSFLSAKIRGAPTFEGDSLRRIHLDAAIQMNLPDEMHFNAYLDIKELTSQSVPLDCIPAGAPAAEVTLGAKDIPLSWLGITSLKPMTLTVEGRWTLQSGKVLGIGGLFDIKGEVGFKGCSVTEIGADFAIGELENFFAAKAAGTITILGIPVDVQLGIFAGHACSLDPLKFIDPDADKVLDAPMGFSGLYLQYGGGLDLAEILFGESSCWLDVRATVSTAVYYQGGPRSGKIGFRQKVAVDLDLICVLSGHVDVALGASATFTPPSDYEIDLVGEANICGKIGYCPFCLEGCKGITIKGVVNDGHIDYHID